MIGQMVPTALVKADGAHTTTTIKAVVEEAGGRSSSPPPTPYHTAPEESSPSPVGSGDRMDLSPDPLERHNSNNNNNSKEKTQTMTADHWGTVQDPEMPKWRIHAVLCNSQRQFPAS